jgi:hypothetical protein
VRDTTARVIGNRSGTPLLRLAVVSLTGDVDW